MKNTSIEVFQSLNYYAVFYMAAFFISFIILIVEGKKRNFPQLPWLIVIVTGFVFFVLGCRIITLSVEDWKNIFANQPLEHSTGLIMLGGLLFCVPAILIAKRLLHFNDSVLDAHAFVLPVGMFIQRIGCFLNGCCSGKVVSGLKYGPDISVFAQLHADKLFPSEGINHAIIHPVQLYESCGCVLAVFLIWRARKKFKSEGSIFYLSGLLYYLVRFVTEFFRHKDAYALNVPSWLHLNLIQWSLIALIVGSIIIIFLNERAPEKNRERQHRSISVPCIAYFVFLSLSFSFASKWLSQVEILVVSLALLTIAVYLVVEFYKKLTVPGLRIASLFLMTLPILMTSQTLPELAPNDSTRTSYNTFSVGGLTGSQDLQPYYEDCDGNKTPGPEYRETYQMAALGFSRTTQTGKAKSFTYGINAYVGSLNETTSGSISYPPREIGTPYGFNPYGQFDLPRFALGAGIHFGRLYLIESEGQGTIIKEHNFYPQFYMRVGRINRIFWEINWARSFPSSFPGNTFQTNLGFPFDKDKLNSGALRIGTSTATAIFFAASIPVGSRFVVEPYLGLGGPFIMRAFDFEDNSGLVGSLNLHYKFDRKAN